MIPAASTEPSPWKASLSLGFERRVERTVLARTVHCGPLRVQKALYPEGPDVCHAVLLHPPGGIAGGDSLRISLDDGPGGHVLITTPGAAKWYRSGGRRAFQTVDIAVDPGGTLEWLPQDTIFFDGTDAEIRMNVDLGEQASFIGAETVCLGRRASGESFTRGRVAMHTRIVRNGRLIWSDRTRIDGGGQLLNAPAGLSGYPCCATLLAAGPGLDSAVMALCREAEPQEAVRSGLTLLPGGLVAGRCLGHDTEPVRRWVLAVWSVLRPALTGKNAIVPRLWNT
jgi:urease accessory protein